MFKMRPEQVEAFDLSALHHARKRLANYLKARFPNRFKDTALGALETYVESVRVIAKQYDIDRENDVGTFLDLSVMYGDDFHLSNWANPILKSDRWGPDRMESLRCVVRASGVNL